MSASTSSSAACQRSTGHQHACQSGDLESGHSRDFHRRYSEPVIGQEIDEADIRMKDGEVSLLGGLSDTTNTFSASGIPGLTNIPILGYLFSTKTRNLTKQDLMIALIPHIVRAPDLSAAAEEAIFAGTERNPHVTRRHEDGVVVPPAGTASPVPPSNPGAPIGMHAPTPVPPARPVIPAPVPQTPPGAAPLNPSPPPGSKM